MLSRIFPEPQNSSSEESESEAFAGVQIQINIDIDCFIGVIGSWCIMIYSSWCDILPLCVRVSPRHLFQAGWRNMFLEYPRFMTFARICTREQRGLMFPVKLSNWNVICTSLRFYEGIFRCISTTPLTSADPDQASSTGSGQSSLVYESA